MADLSWLGGNAGVTATQQVWKGTITTTTNGHTYIITLTDEAGGTVAITYVVANPPDTSVTLVATGFITAWNASTDTRIAAITATQNVGQVILTADTAGVPFSVAATGTGTWSGTGNTIPNAGPNDAGTAANYSTGAVPTSSDNLTIDARGYSGSTYDILYSLDQSAVTLTSLSHYVGAPAVGTTSAALKISATTASLNLAAQGVTTSGTLVNLNFGTAQTACTDYGSSYAGTTLPGTIVAGTHASNTFTKIAGATAGIGVLTPGQASTFVTISVRGGTLIAGSNITWSTVVNNGGTVTLGKGASAGTLTNSSGTTTVNGTTTVGTVNANGGTVKLNNRTTAVTTLNLNGGTVDFTGNSAAVTVTTTNVNDGGGAIKMLTATQGTFTNKFANGLSTKTMLTFSPA